MPGNRRFSPQSGDSFLSFTLSLIDRDSLTDDYPLLSISSNAKPKIADYPFTTVVPNLGVCDLFSEQIKNGETTSASSLVIADIPGLLEGAHEGVGLGLAFLRHIQRCR